MAVCPQLQCSDVNCPAYHGSVIPSPASIECVAVFERGKLWVHLEALRLMGRVMAQAAAGAVNVEAIMQKRACAMGYEVRHAC